MRGVRVRLLGGFQLEDLDGRALDLSTRKTQALALVLARSPGLAHPRARLAALLWPDRADEQARASLRQSVASLRRALAAAGTPVAGVVAAGDTLALDPDGLEIDVVELERALAAGDPARALSWWRGPLGDDLDGLEGTLDDWLGGERAALHARLLEGCRGALARLVAGGEVDAGLALGEQALAVDATFEPAYRARMRLLAARGDRAAALREHQRCRDALARGLSVAPDAETETLARELAAASATAAATATGPAPERASPRAPAAAHGLPSLAVLPFESLSEDATHQLFARGLVEDILAALSRFRTLHVIARDSAWRAAAAGGDAAQVGRELGVDYLLTGSVRHGSGRLRVNPQLVEVRSGRQVWADRIDADLADLFAVQDRVTEAVVGALALQIDAAELAQTRRRAPETLDLYACCLRGMECIRGGTPESDLEARRWFERALEHDPRFARAWVGLSLSYFNDWSCAAWERWEECERQAYTLAERAILLDDRDHVSQYILARVLLYRREFERAEQHLARAYALNPNDADGLAHLALGHAYLGQPERGLELGETARRLHPFHPDWYLTSVALNHFGVGQVAGGLPLLERAPDAYVDTRALLAAGQAHLGETARAREHLDRFLRRFRADIARDESVGLDEAIAWVQLVNPFRRARDREWLDASLRQAAG